MFKIKFELNNDLEDAHEFDLGHLSISDSYTKICSKNKCPDQSMMIFIAISDLLFSIQKLSESKNKVKFVGADSSFILNFKKLKNNKIEITDSNDGVIHTSMGELIEVVWKEVNLLYKKHSNSLIGSGAALEDWEDSMSSFKLIMNK